MDEAIKRITIYAPAWLAEAIKHLAIKEHRSVNQEILQAIEAYLKQHQEQQD